MSTSLNYRLTGRGWSECEVHIGERSFVASASYLSDALGDLCRAFVALVEGAPRVTARFAEEPGEYRWVIERSDHERARVQIYSFNETFDRRPDSDGRLEFEGECRLRTIAGSLLSELQRLLVEHGEAGYRERWVNHDFPTEQMNALRSALSKTAPN